MKGMIRASLWIGLAAVALAGCSKIKPINAPALNTGWADFRVVAAMGTSISAGYQSGGLVDRHQTRSYVSLFARQVGARPLDLPLVNGNGIPPLLHLRRLQSPTIIDTVGYSTYGQPYNTLLPTAYHNMGIPGAILADALDSSLVAPQGPPRSNGYFAFIKRVPVPIVRQIATMLSPAPTFVIVEYGVNEILGPATRGSSNTAPFSATLMASLFNQTLDTLTTRLPGVTGAILNVPDITSIPFFTTLPPVLLDATGAVVRDSIGRPRMLLGPGNAPLGANDLVLLKASTLVAAGYGYPLGTTSYLSGTPRPGTGIGLADTMVLSSTEALALQGEVRKFNTVIDTVARRRRFAVVDLNGLLRRVSTTGIALKGITYTSKFVTGGLFSLDGVHPNDLGHALICNQLIDAVNAKFAANIVHLEASQYATLTASRAGPVSVVEPGLPPYVVSSETMLRDAFPWRGAPRP
jgi:lysophospholipase L1-like esterase